MKDLSNLLGVRATLLATNTYEFVNPTKLSDYIAAYCTINGSALLVKGSFSIVDGKLVHSGRAERGVSQFEGNIISISDAHFDKVMARLKKNNSLAYHPDGNYCIVASTVENLELFSSDVITITHKHNDIYDLALLLLLKVADSEAVKNRWANVKVDYSKVVIMRNDIDDIFGSVVTPAKFEQLQLQLRNLGWAIGDLGNGECVIVRAKKVSNWVHIRSNARGGETLYVSMRDKKLGVRKFILDKIARYIG